MSSGSQGCIRNRFLRCNLIYVSGMTQPARPHLGDCGTALEEQTLHTPPRACRLLALCRPPAAAPHPLPAAHPATCKTLIPSRLLLSSVTQDIAVPLSYAQTASDSHTSLQSEGDWHLSHPRAAAQAVRCNAFQALNFSLKHKRLCSQFQKINPYHKESPRAYGEDLLR